jgi:hypothetical protein
MLTHICMGMDAAMLTEKYCVHGCRNANAILRACVGAVMLTQMRGNLMPPRLRKCSTQKLKAPQNPAFHLLRIRIQL